MWSARLAAAAALALALLVEGSSGSTGSGLYGTVTKGPIRPVCQQGVPCDAPARVTLVFSSSTSSRHDGVAHGTFKWKTVRPNANGRYRVALAPGIWTVESRTKVGVSKLPKPHAVHVRAGHWDRIDLFFDTGIR